MRAANHHGRGSAKHAGREFDVSKAPHIDPAKCSGNRYWTWNGETSLEAAERTYYRATFSDALDIQNELHRQRRQYKRVRNMGQVYESRNTQPEGSLLYIGCKKDGLVDPAVLWACAEEYRAWEHDTLGGCYVPLSMALHVDERGQYHVEERGVYQYQDDAGNWQIGQAAALEAAGVPLPDPSKPRSKDNNRKMSWDAARREKWLDIVEAHGFKLEREPIEHSPHMGLQAWQAWQDAKAKVDAQAADQAAKQAMLDAQEAGLKAEDARLKKKSENLEKVADYNAKRFKAMEDKAKKDADKIRQDAKDAAADIMDTAKLQITLWVQQAMHQEIIAAREEKRKPDVRRAADAAVKEAWEKSCSVHETKKSDGSEYGL